MTFAPIASAPGRRRKTGDRAPRECAGRFADSKAASRGRKERQRRAATTERSCKARAPGAPHAATVADGGAQPHGGANAGGVRAGDHSGAKRRRSGHRVTRPPFPWPARTENRPDPSRRVRGLQRAPGHTDPAERDVVETQEREPPADRKGAGHADPPRGPKRQRRPRFGGS